MILKELFSDNVIILWSVIPDFIRETHADADAKQERIISNYVWRPG